MKILDSIADQYSLKLKEAQQPVESVADILMNKLGVTPLVKRSNMQLYSSNLGRCWEKLVCSTFEETQTGKKSKQREYDIDAESDGIDTKYRVASQDGTKIYKLAANARKLKSFGKKPVMLILRTDNYEAGLRVLRSAGWNIKQGDAALEYIADKTGFSLKGWLSS